jgi:hypothetical protein
MNVNKCRPSFENKNNNKNKNLMLNAQEMNLMRKDDAV